MIAAMECVGGSGHHVPCGGDSVMLTMGQVWFLGLGG